MMNMLTWLIAALIMGVLTDILLMYLLGQKQYPFSVILSVIAMLVLFKTFSEEIIIIKGFLFAQILIFAGYYDAKTKIIPDMVHIFILLTGMINISPVHSVAGILIVPIPYMITAIIKPEGIGGGDIKLMAASGFLLGIKGGFTASIIGLVLAVIVNGVYYKLKAKDKNISFALAPYLSIGCFIAYLKIM